MVTKYYMEEWKLIRNCCVEPLTNLYILARLYMYLSEDSMILYEDGQYNEYKTVMATVTVTICFALSILYCYPDKCK